MSSIILLRRSPKPGALTAAALNVPRSLFTIRVARASPSTSSEMMRSGSVALHDLVENREHVLDVADLLVGDQDIGVVENGLHTILVVDEVRREVALVELHTLGELELQPEGLAVLNVHHAVLADLVDGVGDDVADLLGAGGNSTHAGDLVALGNLGALRPDLFDRPLDGLVYTGPQNNRVGPRRDVLQALADDDLGENRRRGRTVTGDVVGLGRHPL